MATPSCITIRTLRLSVIAASVCVRVSACVRACVREREREREQSYAENGADGLHKNGWGR